MFTTLISSVLQFAMAVVAVVCIYYVFLSDWVENLRDKHKETKSKSKNIEKIAQVKLVSDDAKGVESFITENAQYLSDQMVGKLVARIEAIKADRVIENAEGTLKHRIESLEDSEEEEPKAASQKA